MVGGDANPTGSNQGAPTVAEFELQRTKIVSAITRLNADVVGLMEIENNGYGDNSAIANLVAALNAAQPDEADHYRWIASPDGKPINTDAITVGLIYRPAKVTPEGGCRPHRAAGAAGRGGGCQRQAGDHQSGDARVAGATVQLAQGDAPLTLVVNHLKSRAPPASRITPTTPLPIRWMARATAMRCGSPPPRCWGAPQVWPGICCLSAT